MTAKNTICLWYDKDAEAAANFYAQTFPDSRVGAVHRAPGDYPSGKEGDVLVVDFTVAGIPCMGLNGGPVFKHNEAFSFQIATDDQDETDRTWNAIVGNGGQESDCGWCKDKWGVSWQITPRALTEALAAGGAEAKRAFDAMMTIEEDRRRRDRSGATGVMIPGKRSSASMVCPGSVAPKTRPMRGSGRSPASSCAALSKGRSAATVPTRLSQRVHSGTELNYHLVAISRRIDAASHWRARVQLLRSRAPYVW